MRSFLDEFKKFESSKFEKKTVKKYYLDLPMIEFYKNYTLHQKSNSTTKEWQPKIKYRNKTVVVCTPSYRWPEDHEMYPRYCRYQLMKHMTYRGGIDNYVNPNIEMIQSVND